MVNIVHKVLDSDADKEEDHVLSDNDRQGLRNTGAKITFIYS